MELDLYNEFETAPNFSISYLEMLLDNDCGNGLWNYFENHGVFYEPSLRINNLHNSDKDAILSNCIAIDETRYRDRPFDRHLLGDLGTQIRSEIIPKLYDLKLELIQSLPNTISRLILISGLFILIGVLTPILNSLIFNNYLVDIFSISATIAFFLYLSIYGFFILKKEIYVLDDL